MLNWCMCMGLIPPRYWCTKCGENIILFENRNLTNGYEWRCRWQTGGSQHQIYKSARKDSWLYESHLSICDRMKFTFMWFTRQMVISTVSDLKIKEKCC